MCPEQHGSITGVFKNQIDWIPLSLGSVRPTQGRTLAVAQVGPVRHACTASLRFSSSCPCSGGGRVRQVVEKRLLRQWYQKTPTPVFALKAQVNGGSQSFNVVNNLRLLGRWMRMFTIPNQSSVPKAWTEFADDGRMKVRGRVGSPKSLCTLTHRSSCSPPVFVTFWLHCVFCELSR